LIHFDENRTGIPGSNGRPPDALQFMPECIADPESSGAALEMTWRTRR
jgi:hypothetical protein